MESRGHELLARSGLAADQNRRLGAGDALDDLEHPFHGGIGAPQTLEELRSQRSPGKRIEEEHPAGDPLAAAMDGNRRDSQRFILGPGPRNHGGHGTPGGKSFGDGPLLRLSAEELRREHAARDRTEQGLRCRSRVHHPQRAIEHQQRPLLRSPRPRQRGGPRRRHAEAPDEAWEQHVSARRPVSTSPKPILKRFSECFNRLHRTVFFTQGRDGTEPAKVGARERVSHDLPTALRSRKLDLHLPARR